MKTSAMIAASAFVLAMSTMTAGLHAEELDEVSDHPMVPRIQDSEIIAYEYVEFDRHVIPWGHYSDGEWQETVEVEGSHEKFAYVLRQPDLSPLPVGQAYKAALETRGFDIEFVGVGRDDLRRRFRREDHFDRDYSRRLGSTARTGGDRDDRRFFGARHEAEDLYVTVFIHENQDDEPVILVNIVEPGQTVLETETVEGTETEDTPEDQAGMDETVAERAALSAEQMQDGLIEDGRVAVQDILFEFDSAEIRQESARALASIAEVMESTPELHLLVVGHTDDVGDFDYNLQLSMERAQSVAAWLGEQHGIDASRLQAAGAGMMAPIASNRTEEGRAENRRVELVETRE